MAFPHTVDTARLTLRRITGDDQEAFLAIWADPDVWRALRPGTRFDPHHAPKRFRHHLRHWEEHGFGLWLIEDRAGRDTAGWVGPCHPDYAPRFASEVEIGWSLRRPFWGRGLATEAAQAAVSAAREHLGPRRLISLIDPANVRSIAVARRLGMQDLGTADHVELDVELRLLALEAVVRP